LEQHPRPRIGARLRQPLGLELGKDQLLDAGVAFRRLQLDEEAGAAARVPEVPEVPGGSGGFGVLGSRFGSLDAGSMAI
jgi:hypothetical protein